MLSRLVLTLMACLMFFSVPVAVAAQPTTTAPTTTSAPADDVAAARIKKVREFRQLQQQFVKAAQAGNWQEALQAATKQTQALPNVAQGYFYQAVCLAKLKKNDDALAALDKAVKRGLDAQVIQAANELAALKDNPKFDAIIADAQKRAQEADKLQAGLAAMFSKKEYQKALEATTKLVELQPAAENGHYYNQACAYAQLGKPDDAMKSLVQAVENGYLNTDAMLDDTDLASLKDRKDFVRLVEQMRKAEREAFADSYQKGRDIEGVKTLEGYPDGGLRWRLRINPAATKAKPSRLIIWLHPSGGSMNDVVEAMSPAFIKRGYALLTFTQKDYRFWSQGDADKLVGATMRDVAKIEGLDVSKPILLGFSAGGQAALVLWSQRPGQFGGLVLDAAYPINPADRTLLPLPKDESYKMVPIFVAVGGNDGGLKVWTKATPIWLKAGVPLVVHTVPGKGHAWVFDKERTEAMMVWLEQVHAGKMPTTTQPASQPTSEATSGAEE